MWSVDGGCHVLPAPNTCLYGTKPTMSAAQEMLHASTKTYKSFLREIQLFFALYWTNERVYTIIKQMGSINDEERKIVSRAKSNIR